MKKILLFVIFISSLFSDDIKLMCEIFSSYQFKQEGKITGISVEIVKAIQKEVGNSSKIKLYPWARALKILNKKKNYALFSMLKTKERENKYKWVGPLDKMRLIFFKKRGSSIKLNSLEDAKKVKKIGVTKGVANESILKSMHFKNLDVKAGVDDENIKKLVIGRIDLWPALEKAALYSAKKMGLSNKIEPIKNVVIFEGDLYIAFNKQTDDKIIKKWQDAFNKLKKNGIIEQIKAKYK